MGGFYAPSIKITCFLTLCIFKMLTVKEIRQRFLDFFKTKQHKIVPAAPIVNKNDPSLLFVNSGMAQFKDYFLGNQVAESPRIANSQKCLRVSGKHNDLEEVGRDSYHQTMFEMLGNWSFGDYFKEEIIEWAWELLTKVYEIAPDRLYVTVFEGDVKDNLAPDVEAEQLWQKWISKDRILRFDKKDNFWEMGSQGPCGPCSEIHVDLRSKQERQKVDARTLINGDHPLVVEIWNLVFIQYERKADKSLELLAAKHVDTGMGLERLAMVLQGVQSNYRTDIFQSLITTIEKESKIRYNDSYASDANTDTAMRVIADHVRAVCCIVADGQLPGNTGAGYVARRVLRRAVRYGYSFLNFRQPTLHKLVPVVAEMFEGVFPEIKAQANLISDTIRAEENRFLRNLERGLKLIDQLRVKNNVISGRTAFVLYDTYGFPVDLTQLVAKENGWRVDLEEFHDELRKQKNRSKEDAEKDLRDWVNLLENPTVEFIGYDQHQSTARVIKYRKVVTKKKEHYQLVINPTPFYPEGGGQIGDTGLLWFGEEKVPVIHTEKENNLIIHWVKKLPQNLDQELRAVIDLPKRRLTENNHTATHLLHAALRRILGIHVQQKGSLVNDKYLRFDFSHPQKVTREELEQVEHLVNQKIRQNIPLHEERSISIDEAKRRGAVMLFGEKYGEKVRIITFDEAYSKELCGGCHVSSTGVIGFFKIIEEASVAAGIRRITAITADATETYIRKKSSTLDGLKELLKNPRDLKKAVDSLLQENKNLRKQIEKLQWAQIQAEKSELIKNALSLDGFKFVGAKISVADKEAMKQLATEICNSLGNAVVVLGAEDDQKATLVIYMPRNLAESKSLHAGKLIKIAAKEIKGGGGGQPFFATAGGKNPAGIQDAIDKALKLLKS